MGRLSSFRVPPQLPSRVLLQFLGTEMASSSAALMSRSIQHLLRRQAAASAPALLAVAGNSVVGRPLPVYPIAQDPVSAGGAANVGFSGRSIDMALFGRVDWPAFPSSEQVKMLAKNSDSDVDDFDGEFDSDEFDDVDSSDFDDDDDDDDEKPTNSKRS